MEVGLKVKPEVYIKEEYDEMEDEKDEEEDDEYGGRIKKLRGYSSRK